jgi:hypothetical protein
MQEQGFLYENWTDRILVVDDPSAIFS